MSRWTISFCRIEGKADALSLALILHLQICPMLRRVFAFWLVILALSPFTAPFCTCDLSTLPSEQATHRRVVTDSTAASESVRGLSMSMASPAESPVAGRAKFFVTSQHHSLSGLLILFGSAARAYALPIDRHLFPPGPAVSLRI
jgi:hypothetical protein